MARVERHGVSEGESVSGQVRSGVYDPEAPYDEPYEHSVQESESNPYTTYTSVVAVSFRENTVEGMPLFSTGICCLTCSSIRRGTCKHPDSFLHHVDSVQ